jgi:poly-gamma-glutamate synthesis protein (capsule biosynthesis protein)
MSNCSGIIRGFVAALLVFAVSPSVFAQTSAATLEIAAVGDILLDRGVRRKMGLNGIQYPFEKVSAVLSAADLTFGNLENPVTDQCVRSEKKYSFRADASFASILSKSGFDVLSLANNHILDCGQTGLTGTLKSLSTEKILAVGAGDGDKNEGTTVVEMKGIKVGFAAFTAISPVKSARSVSGVLRASPETVAATLDSLDKRSDLVVASFHWGTEYALDPNTEQVELARLAVESGADIVLGHHPHVLQRIQLIDRGPRNDLQ